MIAPRHGTFLDFDAIFDWLTYSTIPVINLLKSIIALTNTLRPPCHLGGVVSRRNKLRDYERGDEIQKWRRSRELTAEGDDHTAYWPSYTLDDSTLERVEKTKETYLVYFGTAKGKTYHHKLPESDWAALDMQATYKLRVTLYGGVTQYEPASAQTMVMPGQAK
jgi:hypothetical protein